MICYRQIHCILYVIIAERKTFPIQFYPLTLPLALLRIVSIRRSALLLSLLSYTQSFSTVLIDW